MYHFKTTKWIETKAHSRINVVKKRLVSTDAIEKGSRDVTTCQMWGLGKVL
jgi:hypothetical protein